MENFLKSSPPVNVSGFQSFLENFQSLKENFRLVETVRNSTAELDELKDKLASRLEEIDLNLRLKRRAAKRAKVDFFVERKEWELYTIMMEDLSSDLEPYAR